MFDLLSADVTGLIAVVLFLLPGFLTVLFFQYIIPARQKSDMQTVVLSVATSVGLSYLIGNTYSLINFISNLQLNLKPTGFLFTLVNLATGILIVLPLTKFMRSKKFDEFNSRVLKRRPFGRLWHYFLNSPENTVVKVFMSDGKSYIGVIKEFSIDPSDDVQELVLWKPVYFDASNGKPVRIREVETVLLEGHCVVSIEKVIPHEAKKIYPDM